MPRPLSPERTICNPIDLPYRYQQIRPPIGATSVHREGADPTVVRYNGRYYMFVSMSRGFFHSTDLVSWTYQPTEKLPALDYAPDARVIDGALIICASRLRKNGPFYRSTSPLEDDFELVSEGSFPFFDPNLFQDDDGSVYLYWGCSNRTPLYGVQLDRTTFAPLAKKVVTGRADPEYRGWERTGENYQRVPPKGLGAKILAAVVGDAPFIEGSWMNKHDGRYYLQYAAPGTESNSYADGYFTSDNPLGPFQYSPHSPFSSKPGGFITGAGHGSTFQDEFGNWWHVGTLRISINHMFERRVGLFPAGFDDDGALFCNQVFADYPMLVPEGEFDPWEDTFAGWMLLSLNKDVTASSASSAHPATFAVDENARTWWTADQHDAGPWLRIDLGAEYDIRAIQVNHADDSVADHAPRRSDGAWVTGLHRSIFPTNAPAQVAVETSLDGVSWQAFSDPRGDERDAPHRFIVVSHGVRARYVRVMAASTPFETPLSLSGVRVFGTAEGEAPACVLPRARRLDERTALVAWPTAERAHGYTVRYGLNPDRLYHAWQVYGQTELRLPTLNAGYEYWVAVDAFGETGVTRGEPVPIEHV
ncbi:family 43 glycosylhydrolase [Leifsonia aquatica]|uniref:family 43 glycosylhydrolase n=1 Tax=Leifsonia aquatica TaxID=144185 RepID=UPI0004690C5B|nr:family 43 glycosylhydrolase [Leifsonia aquatica]